MKRLATVVALVAVVAIAVVVFWPRTYRDGVFEAYSPANDRGYVWARVTIARDRIAAVELKEYDGVGLEKDLEIYVHPQTGQAIAHLQREFVRRNTANVDVFTGATSTSNKAIQAVQLALEKALNRPRAAGRYFNGTFMAISDVTERGWGIAWVTLQNDRITQVVLHETTPRRDEAGHAVTDAKGRVVFTRKAIDGDRRYPHEPWHTARVNMAADMVARGRPTVDTVTGATGSARRWIQAAERALEMARR
ncbi:MAG TPA: hypothetical protein DCM14_07145 [Clostridiales bacterium UBA8153]|nr:hypothetical protein [Clostridiales bacterium UBA8153]